MAPAPFPVVLDPHGRTSPSGARLCRTHRRCGAGADQNALPDSCGAARGTSEMAPPLRAVLAHLCTIAGCRSVLVEGGPYTLAGLLCNLACGTRRAGAWGRRPRGGGMPAPALPCRRRSCAAHTPLGMTTCAISSIPAFSGLGDRACAGSHFGPSFAGMIALGLCIFVSTLMFSCFRLFPRMKVRLEDAIVINYMVAAAPCPWPSLVPNTPCREAGLQPSSLAGAAMGVIFPLHVPQDRRVHPAARTGRCGHCDQNVHGPAHAGVHRLGSVRTPSPGTKGAAIASGLSRGLARQHPKQENAGRPRQRELLELA